MPYNKEIFQKLGMTELPLRMPNIKRIMKKGVTFTNVITPSPLCAPARACLASGLRYKDCRVVSNSVDYPVDLKTYYSALKEVGYIVSSVGKLDLHKPTLYWGLNGWIPDLDKIGFTHVIDSEGKWDAFLSLRADKSETKPQNGISPQIHTPKGPYMKYLQDKNLLTVHMSDFKKRFKKYYTEPTPLPEESYGDNWITQNALTMLNNFPKDNPWHLVVNFTGPHEPWDVTERMKKEWENVPFPKPFNGNVKKVDEEIKIRQNYAAMLENIDRNIGIIIDKVKDRGEIDNTIIIYASDHGEMLGDFNKHGKQLPQRGSTHIPLVISGLNISKGQYDNQLVELQDLTNTILDYAQISMKEAKASISLKDLLEGNKNNHRKYQISALNLSGKENSGWKLIKNERYKLVIEKDMEFKLYDLNQDPWESDDCSKENPIIVKELLNELQNVYLER
ncbi:MAG: sulfatase [Candidatus Hodarchaeota archaeon]